jgi:hypothetical protein
MAFLEPDDVYAEGEQWFDADSVATSPTYGVVMYYGQTAERSVE